MMTGKRKKALKWVVIPIPILLFVVFAPRFFFVQTRITNELNQKLFDDVWLGPSPLESLEIVDYRGRWFSVYVKLKLSKEEYNRLKQKFFQSGGATSSKDFTKEIVGDTGRYLYNPNRFFSELSVINNVKRRYKTQSMDLDDYEELIILISAHDGWIPFITHGGYYVLEKENGGNCFLYIYA